MKSILEGTRQVPYIFLSGLSFLGCVSSSSFEEKIKTEKRSNLGCQLPKTRYAWSKTQPPKLIWLSLDSLNEAGLSEIVGQLKKPHPKGLKWLAQAANRNNSFKIHEPTITASSHISTITCSTASTHGVFANFHFVDGKISSGFSAPFRTETFATTLQKNGLNVVTGAYPALDNSESGRMVNEGFTYSEALGSGQTYSLKTGEPLKHVWRRGEDKTWAELSLSLPENALPSVECKDSQCWLEPSKIENIWDLTIVKEKQKLRSYIQKIEGKDSSVYIAPLTKNNAFPDEVSKKLDDCNFIFSPGKESSLARWGAPTYTKGLEHRLSFFDSMWAYYLPSTNADVIFLYLEDLDALRHQYSGDRSASDALASHYERVDKVLGEFFESLPASTNVVVLGDHGMSTIRREINIRQILKTEFLNKVTPFTSGGTLMLFGAEKQKVTTSAIPDHSDNLWLEEIRKQLLNFKLPGEDRKVFQKVFIKNTPEMRQAGLEHAHAPFVIAFSDQEFALQNSVSNELILADAANPKSQPPRPRGQHGHASESPAMLASLIGWGPIVGHLDLKSVSSNIELVPRLANAFHWQSPPQCRSDKN